MMGNPHVSEVIKPWLDPTWWTDEARDRGLRIHGKCAAHLLGTWSPTLPPEEQGYFDSFLLWEKFFQVLPLSIEKRYDDPLGFCGTPDFIGQLLGIDPRASGPVAVIDWKTPVTKYPAWIVAGSAYFRLAQKNGWPVERVGNLQLQADGKPAKMTWIEEPEKIFPVFLSCLNAWRFFNR